MGCASKLAELDPQVVFIDRFRLKPYKAAGALSSMEMIYTSAEPE
jgi:hypothetical protein